jgi:CitB family two-component system response regulator MalR
MIKVIIVEDDPMVAQFNQHYLEQIEGYQCAGVVTSVDEAIVMIQEVKPQLILLDLYMRKKGGFDLLRLLRSNAENVDVIIISAARDPESIKKALQYGAVDYLIKPFHFSRFKEALENYRDRFDKMTGMEHVGQEEVDHLIKRSHNTQTMVQELPKGLTLGTLNIIWEVIKQYGHQLFSTDDISASSGISRVSVRKYLSFMLEIGILESEISYGTGGRPLDQFRVVPGQENWIHQYKN